MRINNLRLRNFRNYQDQSVSFHPSANVIWGENAQGKTNLLEALLYLSCGKSPRTRGDRELFRFGEDSFDLDGTVTSRDREFLCSIHAQQGRRKQIKINQVPAKTAGQLSEVLNTVYFAPEDLLLIRDGAAARRKFMDASLCQLRPRYAQALAEYHRLWEHKTRILRDQDEKPDLLRTLPDFEYRMAETGAVLIHYRSRFAGRLTYYAAMAHGECSGGKEALSVKYQTVKTVKDPLADLAAIRDQLLEHQEQHRKAELSVRQCLSGPHKDDLEVLLGERSARSFASQGQTRTAAIAMKLAAREIHREILGEYPILLLDDVLSELDPRRQEFVLNRLGEGQVFITCCEEDRLDSLARGQVLYVAEGQIYPEK